MSNTLINPFTNAQPVANGAMQSPAPMAHPQPQANQVKFFRNKLTGKQVTLDNGNTVDEWEVDSKGQVVQEPVTSIEHVKAGDSVVITNMQVLAFTNPALFIEKLNSLRAQLPSGDLNIAPISKAVMIPTIGRRAHFSAKGSWVGFIAQNSDSGNAPTALTI